MSHKYKSVGDVVRKSREKVEMTQIELSELLGFTKSFLSQVEHGRSSLAIKYHLQIALLLGIKPIDLKTAWINDQTAHYKETVS